MIFAYLTVCLILFRTRPEDKCPDLDRPSYFTIVHNQLPEQNRHPDIHRIRHPTPDLLARCRAYVVAHRLYKRN